MRYFPERENVPSMLAFFIVFAFVCLSCHGSISNSPTIEHWSWFCKAGKCLRSAAPSSEFSPAGSSEEICKLTCGKYGSIWPKPTGTTNLSRQVVAFHPSKVNFDYAEIPNDITVQDYLQRASKIFHNNLYLDCGPDCSIVPETQVTVCFTVESNSLTLNWNTDESYTLNVATNGIKVTVLIGGKTVYGIRHGLETLNQLIAGYSPSTWEKSPGRNFIDKYQLLVLVSSAEITDAPVYRHRGLLVDTARNFLSMETLRKTIDAMAMNKLNVLHWHATDSQSFPLESPRVPELTKYGAYSEQHVYSAFDTRELIEYARLRGIRVIIEIDAPAHSGNGWQWGESKGLGELAVCVNKQPWRSNCIQPPCGQLNPVNPNLYAVLRNLFKDIIDFLPPGEVFHMGGDEVFFPCWNNTKEIVDWLIQNNKGRTTDDFLKLWADYQETVLRIFDEENPIANTPVILWSSHLTDPTVVESFLDKNRYIIETWVPASDSTPFTLLEKGYRLIIATKDTWYLDHGFWGTTTYHNWRTAYQNVLPKHPNVLGGEAAIWGELVDDQSLDVKVWPRAAAVAERLWSDPAVTTKDLLAAEPRLQQIRNRLVARGIHSDAISPMYCTQNEAECL